MTDLPPGWQSDTIGGYGDFGEGYHKIAYPDGGVWWWSVNIHGSLNGKWSPVDDLWFHGHAPTAAEAMAAADRAQDGATQRATVELRTPQT